MSMQEPSREYPTPSLPQMYQMILNLQRKVDELAKLIQENEHLMKDIQIQVKKLPEETKTVTAGSTVIVRM